MNAKILIMPLKPLPCLQDLPIFFCFKGVTLFSFINLFQRLFFLTLPIILQSSAGYLEALKLSRMKDKNGLNFKLEKGRIEIWFLNIGDRNILLVSL